MFKRFFLFFLFLIGIIVCVEAQPGDGINAFSIPGGSNPCMGYSDECDELCSEGCGAPGCQPCIEGTQIPLDGGLLWLLLAGAGYGVKKIVDHKKKQQVL
jgi:hypothetical protein